MTASASSPAFALPAVSRNTTIALGVVAFHVAVLWAFQSGLLQRTIEVIVPASILTEFVTPPAPKVEQPKPVPPEPPKPRPVIKQVRPAPQPLAIPDPTPSPNAPTGVLTPPPPAPPAPITAPVSNTPPSPPAPPAPPRIELPSSNADYLQNPAPGYPSISRRMNEQGKVLLRVLIGVDGTAQKVELRRSSGFDRLDQSAMSTVQKWRFVPGKRNGVAEAMWYEVPINFVLE